MIGIDWTAKNVFHALGYPTPEEEEERHKKDCAEGKHNFVPCDEWEPTCLYCGKFQT